MAGKLSTYWPPGDILNFWPTLLRVAAERMLPQNRPPYLKTLLEHHAISGVRSLRRPCFATSGP